MIEHRWAPCGCKPGTVHECDDLCVCGIWRCPEAQATMADQRGERVKLTSEVLDGICREPFTDFSGMRFCVVHGSPWELESIFCSSAISKFRDLGTEVLKDLLRIARAEQ